MSENKEAAPPATDWNAKAAETLPCDGLDCVDGWHSMDCAYYCRPAVAAKLRELVEAVHGLTLRRGCWCTPRYDYDRAETVYPEEHEGSCVDMQTALAAMGGRQEQGTKGAEVANDKWIGIARAYREGMSDEEGLDMFLAYADQLMALRAEPQQEGSEEGKGE